MSKTKRRKTTTYRADREQRAVSDEVEQARPVRTARRSSPYAGGTSLQNVAFAAMLTCGFFGMAIFFAFFYNEDANHYFYAGVAALTALGWLALCARRWSQYRQRA